MSAARSLARPRVPFRVTLCLAAFWCLPPKLLWFPSLLSFGTFVRGF